MKITKKNFNNFTKEEIVSILISNPEFYRTEVLINSLKKMKRNQLFDEYDELVDLSCEADKDYSEYAKQLLEKYGKLNLSLLKKGEIEKLTELNNKRVEYENKIKKIDKQIDSYSPAPRKG